MWRHLSEGAILASLLFLLGMNYALAQVVVDGTTQTSISTNAAGHITVQIAPTFEGVTGDISHNSYTDFNVLVPGVSLDNRLVDARTIVNEVTSTNPSLISGTLEVLGPRAHVILANPNGITVNGGRFINTGGVALSTGALSYIDRDITPITTQRNALLRTNYGIITIGEDGLAGTFTNLELVAKQIHIEGPVTNESSLADAAITLIGGSTQVEYDSSISVIDATNDWSHVDTIESDQECPNAICIDITGMGSLSSSKVEIVVTEQGAGVNMDGLVTTSQGDFVLTVNGDITVSGEIDVATNALMTTTDSLRVSGGIIVADSHIVLNTDQTILTSQEGDNDEWDIATLQALQGGLLIETRNFFNQGGLVQGNTTIVGSESSAGAVTILASGGLENRSLDTKAMAIIFAENDDLVITATNDITNITGRLLSNDGVYIRSSEGGFYQIIEKEDIAREGELVAYNQKGGKSFFRTKKISGSRVDFGDPLIQAESALISAGQDVVIEAQTIRNEGGNIYAQDGAAYLTSHETIYSASELTGSAYKETICAWFCKEKGGSTITSHGGEIRTAGNLYLTANSDIHNLGGVIQSLQGNIILDSPEPIIAEAQTTYDVMVLDRGIFNSDIIQFMKYDQGGSFIANMGRLQVDSLSPMKLIGGTVTAEEEDIPGGIESIRETESAPQLLLNDHIGLLGGLF